MMYQKGEKEVTDQQTVILPQNLNGKLRQKNNSIKGTTQLLRYISKAMKYSFLQTIQTKANVWKNTPSLVTVQQAVALLKTIRIVCLSLFSPYFILLFYYPTQPSLARTVPPTVISLSDPASHPRPQSDHYS